MKKYDPKKIEPKWQKAWEKSGIYKAKDGSKKKKWFSLIEFPYPSGDGLHTGHIRSNTAMDIISRKRRMEGYNVLYPIGWDAFGLPTENYAIKTGIHPIKVTKKNTDTFRRQLKSVGFSFDWDREINTTDPEYYKWTQWIFLQLFKKGLAYKENTTINWCPKDLVGLANEEVINGCCERCGTPVVKKEKDQWMLAITKYADRLDKDLDQTDFLPQIKLQQRNWIGRSEGAELGFELNVKRNYVILHGYTATSEDDFIPWLKAELEKRGHTVQTPNMPNTKNPNVYEQVNYVLDNCKFDDNTILIGHSLGSLVAIKVAEKLSQPLVKLVLVAGFMQPRFKDKTRPFEKDFDWQFDYASIKKNAPRIAILRAENDSCVHTERADYIKSTIGGEIIDFKAEDNHVCGEREPVVLDQALDKVKIYTTRPDTLFGVTYIVLAPEHSLVSNLKNHSENKTEIEAYVKKAAFETDTERTAENRPKTGVEIKGVKAVNPANGEEVPVFVSDYVLASYGTGAVMAVPAHDARDFAFAKKHNLPIKQVIAPIFETKSGKDAIREDANTVKRRTVNCIVKHWKEDKYIGLDWKKFAWKSLVIGGVEDEEEEVAAAMREVTEETGYTDLKYMGPVGGVIYSHYYAEHKQVNRYAETVCHYFELKNGNRNEVDEKEEQMHHAEWVDKDKMADFLNLDNHRFTWNVFLNGEKSYDDYGILINSGSWNGKRSEDVFKEITESVGGKWVTKFKLRDWVFSRQRYWGEPIPLVYCEQDGWVPIPEKELPLKLPNVKEYQPSGDGESPLSRVPKWFNTKCPVCGGKAKRETDTMPNWAGSSWYFLRYADPKNNKAIGDPKKLAYWQPVDWYNGGAEHITLHLLYSRFWNKFLYDIGVAPSSEPYVKRTLQGMILGAGGVKMSKSKGNVVNPDETVKNYGADTLRVYEMFMGPFDQSIAWSTESIIGSRRFLDKVWNISQKASKVKATQEVESITHKTIKKVSEDIEAMSFNTAISSMMIWANEMDKLESVPVSSVELFAKILSPFAPHIAEEIWAELGHKKSIHIEEWPTFDPTKISTGSLNMVVQINGKVRDTIAVSAGLSQEQAMALALEREVIKKWTEGNEVKKVIYVQDRLLNFVI